MIIATDIHPLLAGCPTSPESGHPETLRDELTELAAVYDTLSVRSRILFEQLRKMLGQERLQECLLGVQSLAVAGEPAGARLLAAFVDANTPGSQLVPRIQPFASTGRLLAHLRRGAPAAAGSELADWQDRAQAVVAACAPYQTQRPGAGAGRLRARDVEPLPRLRHAMQALVPRERSAVNPDNLGLLAELVRLEADAYQERVSQLAGSIDPFRVTIVVRALPLLGRADAEIRDLGQLVAWLEAGNVDAAFRQRVPRFHEVLDGPERPRLTAALHADPRLAPLAAVHDAQRANPLAIRQLAGPVAQLLAVGRQLAHAGVRRLDLDLVNATAIALAHCPGGRLRLPLTPELQSSVGAILVAPSSCDPWSAPLVGGLALENGYLIARESRQGLSDRIWRHDLPTPAELATSQDPLAIIVVPETIPEDEVVDQSTFAVKQMVLANLGCVSIVLGFLRNPKVTAIPGLVGEIARRSRSARVIEVIATDRTLHDGFANKDVPRALLETPVNVSVKALRKFVHVKYVSKTDLKRMAADKARLRKDVISEIKHYLDSLV